MLRIIFVHRLSVCTQGNVFIEHRVSSIQYPVSNKGFTLIEILVAMSVLAISLVVILQLFSGGLKSVRLSDQYTRAIFYAREKMEEILLMEDLETGSQEGKSDESLRWRAEVVLIEPDEEEVSELPYDSLKIVLEVMWEEGEKEKHFQISTMKVVKKKEDEELGN